MRHLIPDWIARQHRAGRSHGRFQAVALLVDISGFTPLTETLMLHHKDGAEVLTAVLNGVFEPILRQVYAHKGLIASFAGDAFTALFPLRRRDAAHHAAQVALAIQHLFAEHRLVQTPYGDFALGARVGLGQGLVEWGILGRAGRFTYFFRGPAVERCTRAEQAAAVGEVIASAELWPLWGRDGAAHQAGAAGQLIGLSAAPAPHRPRLPSLDRADLRPFLLDEVIDLAVPAEFRDVASLFVSFEEPAQTASLNDFVAHVLEQAQNYGGYLNKLDFGDKGPVLLVLFGAPVAHENDLARAVDFLLALQQRPLGVRWRAGLSRGTVYAGFVGGPERCEYTAIGDTVNLAARLMAQAPWGSILLTADQAARLAPLGYRTELQGTIALKGKGEPVAAARLAGRGSTAQVRFQGVLVGRTGELQQLHDLLQPLFERRFVGVVSIYGEAGVGKSRLVHELRKGLAGRASWFTCPADETLRQSLNPFQHFLRYYLEQSSDRDAAENARRFDAVLERLRSRLEEADAAAARQLVPELERLRPFLGALVDLHWAGSLYEQLGPQLRFENTLAAFRAWIRAESLCRPAVLFVEDAHRLDPDSQALIHSLVQGAEGYPFAVVLAGRCRDDGQPFDLDLGDVPCQALALAPLPAAEIPAVAAHVLGGPVAAGLVSFLAEKAGGNPFFVEQLALDFHERGALSRTPAGTWDLSSERAVQVPGNIQAVLVARLDRLAGPVRAVVQTAAVLGQEFEIRILSQMLRDDPSLPAKVQQAQEAAIWLPLDERRCLFRHALLRDAAYDMQLRAQLRQAHTAAARAIEQVHAVDLAAHAAQLAYHWGAAHNREQERHYARLAGEQAMVRFANAEAVLHLARALELTPAEDAADRFDLLLSREQVYDLQGRRDLQRQDVEMLAALAAQLGDPLRQAEAALRQATFRDATVDYGGAIAAAQDAIARAHAAGDPVREAAGWRWWGQALWQQAGYAEARQKLERARRLAGQRRLAQDPRARQTQAESLRSLGMVCSEQGDYGQAQRHFLEALRLYRQAGDQRLEGATLNNLGLLYNAQGDYPRAREYFEQSYRIAQEIGNRREQSRLLNNLGIVHAYQGDYAGARAYYERAIDAARAVGDRRCEALALNNLGMATSSQDGYARTIECYEQARQLAHEIGDRRCEALALNNLALVYMDQGNYAAAQEHLAQALASNQEIANQPGECMATYNLGLIALGRGQLDTAQGYLQAALAIAREIGDRRMEAYALNDLGTLRSDLGRWDEAEAAYHAALAIRQELGQPALAIETRASLGELALRRQDVAAAAAYAAQVVDYLDGGGRPDGMSDPSRVYLITYRVLAASGDPRAPRLLRDGARLLQDRAAHMDEATRRTFFEQVPANRDLLALYGALEHPSDRAAGAAPG